jgi:hypothetical protein
MTHQVLLHDNLDDRREVFQALKRLPPGARVAFVNWCCRRAVLPGSRTHPGVARRTQELAELARRDDAADERLTVDLFFDLWNLSLSFDFTLDDALAELVRRARTGGRGQGAPPAPPAPYFSGARRVP